MDTWIVLLAFFLGLVTGLSWRYMWNLASAVRRGKYSEDELDDVDMWGV
jgi:hypothetical protein